MFYQIRHHTLDFHKHCIWRSLKKNASQRKHWQDVVKTLDIPAFSSWVGYDELNKTTRECWNLFGTWIQHSPQLWCVWLWHLQETAPELLAVLRCPRPWHWWTHWHLDWASSVLLLLLAVWQQEALTQQAVARERKSMISFLLPRRLVFGAPSHWVLHRENGAIRWVACHLQNCFHLHLFFPSFMSMFWFYHILLSERSHVCLSPYFSVSLMSVLTLVPSDNIFKYNQFFFKKMVPLILSPMLVFSVNSLIFWRGHINIFVLLVLFIYGRFLSSFIET